MCTILLYVFVRRRKLEPVSFMFDGNLNMHKVCECLLSAWVVGGSLIIFFWFFECAYSTFVAFYKKKTKKQNKIFIGMS